MDSMQRCADDEKERKERELEENDTVSIAVQPTADRHSNRDRGRHARGDVLLGQHPLGHLHPAGTGARDREDFLNDLIFARGAAESAVQSLKACIDNAQGSGTNRAQAAESLARATEFVRRSYGNW